MYCSRCGSPNQSGARFCEKCGFPLAAQAAAPGAPAGNDPPAVAPPPPGSSPSPGSPPPLAYPTAPPVQPQVAYQPQQAAPYADPRVRGAAPVVQAPGSKGYAVGKSPVVAVLLSFLIPGVGHFYCGESKKGGIMLAVYLVGWFLFFTAGIGGLVVLGVTIWSMIDAYNIASGKTPLS